MGDYEDYKEILAKRENSSHKIYQNIKPIHIAIIIGILLVVNQIIKTNDNNTFLYVVLGAGFLLFLFSNMRGSEQQGQIPRGLAQKIALQDLKSEVRPDGSYPIGTTVFSTSYFKDKSVDTGEGWKLIKYNIGFKIKLPNNPEKEINYQMSPFTGECKGIVEMPMGFTGQEVKDVQLVFPEATLKSDKPSS